MKKAAAYARVSTTGRAQEHSFEFQSKYWNQTLGNSEEYEYVGLFADKGISGKLMNRRPRFLALMELCDRNGVDIIFTKSVQRFARNTVECLNIARELSNRGITIYFETNGIDTADPGSWLILSIMASIAEEESRTISHNVSWAYQKKFQKGEYAGGQIYGYKIKNNKFQIIQDEALIVRRIFNEFMTF